MDIDPKKLLRDKKVIAEINRHKWLESEIAGFDVGFEAAAEDWLRNHAEAWVKYHGSSKPTKPANGGPKTSAAKKGSTKKKSS